MLHEAEAVGAGTMASNSTKILPTCQERGQSSAAECWKGMQVNPVLCKSKKKKNADGGMDAMDGCLWSTKRRKEISFCGVRFRQVPQRPGYLDTG